MQISVIPGWIATIGSCIFLIPQIFKAIKNKNAKELSALTYICIAISSILWIIYGLHFGNTQIWVANLIITLLNSIILFLKILSIFKKNKVGKNE